MKVFLSLIAMIFITIAFVLLTFFGIKIYTNHDSSIKVPNIKGKSFYDAKEILSNNNLDYLVIDSSYNDKFPPLSILDQVPEKGSSVKEQRKIYLTINSSQPPMVKIPNLIDNSRRQAELILNSWGLKIGNLFYQPDLSKDAVLALQINGENLPESKLVKKGTAIDLVLGDGYGSQVSDVPPLDGLTVLEAKAVLEAVHLNLGEIVAEGDIQDTMSAMVYSQEPMYGTVAKLGPNNTVKIFITQMAKNSTPTQP